MSDAHGFTASIEWQGNRGTGTSGYREYGRQLVVRGEGKPDIVGSAAHAFHGDAERWNPEEMLIVALAECHMLSYLRSAVTAGVIVTAYTDDASGTVRLEGVQGAFEEVVLRPRVTVADASMVEAAREAHAEAGRNCFIARSVNFPVRHEPEIVVAEP